MILIDGREATFAILSERERQCACRVQVSKRGHMNSKELPKYFLCMHSLSIIFALVKIQQNGQSVTFVNISCCICILLPDIKREKKHKKHKT